MTFDEKQLKTAVETIVLPEERKARIKSKLQERLSEDGDEAEREGWGPVPRRLFLAGMAACFAIFFGVGLWRGGLNRVWSGLWAMEEKAPVDSEPDHGIGSAPSQPDSSEDHTLGIAEAESDPEQSDTGEILPPDEPPYEPPASIILDGLSELEEMRGMAVCTDEDVLQAYLDGIKGMGASSRGDLTAFLELLDSLPYLPVLEGEITSIQYTPEWQLMEIVTEAANGDWVRLSYYLAVDEVHAEIEAWKEQEPDNETFLPEPFVCCGGRVEVWREVRVAEPGMFLLYWDIEADGYPVRVNYCPADLDADRVVLKDLFSNLTVQSIADLS